MSAIVHDILAVSMSTVASKFTFSIDPCIVDEKSSRMTNEIIEKLLSFKDWLDTEMRFQDKDKHDTTSDDDDNTNTIDV